MSDMLIRADGADVLADARPPKEENSRTAAPDGAGMETLSAGDYCHLAEECFFLAAVAKDQQTAADLLKAGDDYLRCASGWLADQLRTR
jgi:hypothetical protein